MSANPFEAPRSEGPAPALPPAPGPPAWPAALGLLAFQTLMLPLACGVLLYVAPAFSATFWRMVTLRMGRGRPTATNEAVLVRALPLVAGALAVLVYADQIVIDSAVIFLGTWLVTTAIGLNVGKQIIGEEALQPDASRVRTTVDADPFAGPNWVPPAPTADPYALTEDDPHHVTLDAPDEPDRSSGGA